MARASRIGATPSLPHRPRLCLWKARARRPHAPPRLVLLAFAPTMTLRLVGGSSQPHRSGRPSFCKAGRLEKNLKEANIARPSDQETTNRYHENERMNSAVHELAFGMGICFGCLHMVAQWYDLRLETRKEASSGHMTTRSMSPQRLRSPMLTFATKKLSTGANDKRSFHPASPFVRANLIELSCPT